MITYCAVAFYTLVIVFFPGISASAVSLSFVLTTQVLLPALLPSVVLSKVLVELFSNYRNRKLLMFFMVPLCVLSGVPSCILILEDAYRKNIITLCEYKTLFILLSNVSLSFVTNYICGIEKNIPVFVIFIIFYVPPVLNSIIYSFYLASDKNLSAVKNSNLIINPSKKEIGLFPENKKREIIFTPIITKAIQTISLIFVYLSMCIIILKVIEKVIKNHNIVLLFSSFIEIISSCNMIKEMPFGFYKFFLLSLSISFGGICSIFQMSGVMIEDDISLGFMFKTKMLNALSALSIGLLIYIIMY